jgi:beta-N-acetylhexosaminidase
VRRRGGLALLAAASVALTTPTPVLADRGPAKSPATIAADAYAHLSAAQRIGQLLMVGVPDTGSPRKTLALLRRQSIGNVILINQSAAGVDGVAALVARVRRATTQGGVSPYVAVDQEGGEVQHLKGPGFATIPTAVRQGQLATSTLRAKWDRWGRQLRRAGVNLDLAPVGDVVPASVGTANKPIGQYYREYGSRPGQVSSHVAAVVHGLRDVGVGSTAKHFPGLGRATGNTDSTAGVTDPTTSTDGYLAPYKRAISVHVPVVMVSTAIYPNIDPGRIGAFSHRIVTEMLRDQLGFAGLIVSDSLNARSVDGYAAGDRAILALDAGVDLVLVTKRAQVAAMTAAIADRMSGDADFARVVRTAVMRVLQAKASAGLISD